MLELIYTAIVASETHLRTQWGLVISKADEAGLDGAFEAGVFDFWILDCFDFWTDVLLSVSLPSLLDGELGLSLEKTKTIQDI